MLHYNTPGLQKKIRMIPSRLSRSSLAQTARFAFSTPKNKSFYRRTMPPHLIALNTYEGKKTFQQSMQQGNCQAFFSLVQHFITQGEPSTCASASMAMVLNALKIDPRINWKGIWRWYDDYNIKHMKQDQLSNGLTLEEYHELIQLNHARSLAFSPLQGTGKPQNHTAIKQSTLQFFRNCISACNRRKDMFLTVNFHRKSLKQTGIGHYSPIAAYNSNRDIALILDVAKFKYDSYWCSVSEMYESLKPVDVTSSISRGFLIVKKKYDIEVESQGAICSLQLDHALNVSLRQSISEAGEQLQDIIVKILNNIQLHPLMIPLLFEYSTMEVEHKQKIIKGVAEDAEIYLQDWPYFSKRLSEEALHLLTVFSDKHPNETLSFLLLVFRLSKEAVSYYKILYHKEVQLFKIIRLVRKCQLSLQINEEHYPQLYALPLFAQGVPL